MHEKGFPEKIRNLGGGSFGLGHLLPACDFGPPAECYRSEDGTTNYCGRKLLDGLSEDDRLKIEDLEIEFRNLYRNRLSKKLFTPEDMWEHRENTNSIRERMDAILSKYDLRGQYICRTIPGEEGPVLDFEISYYRD